MPGSGLTSTVVAVAGVELGLGLLRNLWPTVIKDVVGATVGTTAGSDAVVRQGGGGTATAVGSMWYGEVISMFLSLG
jgi:hypothetical protein